MLFNSGTFAAFFGLVFLFYYAPPLRRFQVGFLILASFVFYAWAWWKPALLLAFAIGLNGWISHRVFFGSPRWARFLAGVAVLADVGLLILCKYGGLLFGGFAGGELQHEPVLRLILSIPLPVGISFFTFESISLVIDSWRSRREPPPWVQPALGRHLQGTALFVSFFPHLVAGPILKARDFLPQLGAKRLVDIPWASATANLVTGYFLKMVVADNLKEVTAFLTPPFEGLQRGDLLCMLFAYSMQIFADFAGYSLIAIGLAELLGYRLVRNFNYPYLARSFSDFWRRWHISLSSWLRDYLYIPLGGSRGGLPRTMANLLVVMMIAGLWHGAAWSFAIWGGIHGVALALERLAGGEGRTTDGWMSAAARNLLVFTAVTAAWVFFKLTDLNQAVRFFAAVAHPPPGDFHLLARHFYTVVFSLPVVVLHLASLREQPVEQLRAPWVHAVMLALIVVSSGESGSFIYFRF